MLDEIRNTYGELFTANLLLNWMDPDDSDEDGFGFGILIILAICLIRFIIGCLLLCGIIWLTILVAKDTEKKMEHLKRSGV